MSSKAHEVIAACLARKMREQGYEIVGLDEDHRYIDIARLPVPRALHTHRPDLLGINLDTLEICIGEAKTTNDITSPRTRTQIAEFSAVRTSDGRLCRVILGVPQSGKVTVERLLCELGLEKAGNILCLYVPDALLSDENV